MAKVVHKWNKNANEEVRASLTTFRDCDLIDLRVWVEDREGKAIPTRKGLTLGVGQVDELKKAVEALEKALA